MKEGTCLYIFTRDLRIEDNTCLNYCSKNFTKIIPLFIITKIQVGDNPYKSDKAISFMKESLKELLKMTKNKLNIIYGNDVHSVISNVIKKTNIKAIIITKDYSPYSINRENELENICKNNSIQFVKLDDYLLYDSFIFNKNNETYKKFTPFYNQHIKKKYRLPYTEKGIIEKLESISSYSKNNVRNLNKLKSIEINKNVTRDYILNHIKKTMNDFIKNYTNSRDQMSIETTRLSVYLKFGIVSVREIYEICKKYKLYIRSLIWRDFYYTYYYNNKDSLLYGEKVKGQIKWSSNINYLNKWKLGKTGFPIIDACMNELNSTGFIHNRGRMIVASFLTKNLLISWKEGEKYFSNKLLDIDWVINSGNWQNVISVAKHSQPYFRVFNPWIQSKKYDKDCKYIKKWIQELKNIPSKDIHEWYDNYKLYDVNYPRPIIDYNIQKKKYFKLIND